MKIIESIDEMREYSQQLKRDGKTIALVNTMGYLHDGHMSLVKIAKENADVVVMCIQTPVGDLLKFSIEWPENYKKYLIEEGERYQQKSLENDLEICRKYKVDIFFYPNMLDYHSNPIQTITIYHAINKRLLDNPYMDNLGACLNWVLDIDLKTWNTVLPDIVVAGQKDIHQNILLKVFANYFHFPIKVIMAPIIRDSDGLALSSRNVYLTQSDRQNALSIYQVLQEVSNWSSYPSIDKIKEYIANYINNVGGDVYFIDICCAETLEELDVIDKETIIVVAAKFGKVDIWDNIIIEPK